MSSLKFSLSNILYVSPAHQLLPSFSGALKQLNPLISHPLADPMHEIRPEIAASESHLHCRSLIQYLDIADKA